jgi:hypothetical protein
MLIILINHGNFNKPDTYLSLRVSYIWLKWKKLLYDLGKVSLGCSGFNQLIFIQYSGSLAKYLSIISLIYTEPSKLRLPNFSDNSHQNENVSSQSRTRNQLETSPICDFCPDDFTVFRLPMQLTYLQTGHDHVYTQCYQSTVHDTTYDFYLTNSSGKSL